MQIRKVETFNQGIFLFPLLITDDIFLKTLKVIAVPNKNCAVIKTFFQQFIDKKFIFIPIKYSCCFLLSILFYGCRFIYIFLPFFRNTCCRNHFLRTLFQTFVFRKCLLKKGCCLKQEIIFCLTCKGNSQKQGSYVSLEFLS